MDQHSINRLDNIERELYGDGRQQPRGGLVNRTNRHEDRLDALERQHNETIAKLDRLMELAEQAAIDAAAGRRAYYRLETLRGNAVSIALMLLALLVAVYTAALPLTLSDLRSQFGISTNAVVTILAFIIIGLMALSLITRRWETNGNGHNGHNNNRDRKDRQE